MKHFFGASLYSLCFVSIAVAAGEASVRRYPLPDHGSIQLNLPASWKDKIRQPPNRFPATITFKQKTGTSFEVLTTPFRPAKKDIPLTEEEGIRQLVLQGVDTVQPQAEEDKIELKRLDGASGPGYYFTATDRAPESGEHKYMTQG